MGQTVLNAREVLGEVGPHGLDFARKSAFGVRAANALVAERGAREECAVGVELRHGGGGRHYGLDGGREAASDEHYGFWDMACGVLDLNMANGVRGVHLWRGGCHSDLNSSL